MPILEFRLQNVNTKEQMGYELFLMPSTGSAMPPAERTREVVLSLGAAETDELMFNFRKLGIEAFLHLARSGEGKQALVLSLEYGGSQKEAEFCFDVAMKLSSQLGLKVFDPQLQQVVAELDFQRFLNRWQQHSNWSMDITGSASPRQSLLQPQEQKSLFGRLTGRAKFLIILVLCLILGFVALRACVSWQVKRILYGEGL